MVMSAGRVFVLGLFGLMLGDRPFFFLELVDLSGSNQGRAYFGVELRDIYGRVGFKWDGKKLEHV